MAEQKKTSGLKPKLQKAKAKFFATYYSNPAKDLKIIAVTGDNGRDITAHYLQKFSNSRTLKQVSLSTLKLLPTSINSSTKSGAPAPIMSLFPSIAPVSPTIFSMAFQSMLPSLPKMPSASQTSQRSPTLKLSYSTHEPSFSILNHDDPNYDFIPNIQPRPPRSLTVTNPTAISASIVKNSTNRAPKPTSLTVALSSMSLPTSLENRPLTIWPLPLWPHLPSISRKTPSLMVSPITNQLKNKEF